MYEMIVKQFLFWTVLYQTSWFLWYICLAKDDTWQVLLQNDVILFQFCN